MGPGQGQLGCPHLLRGLLHVLVHPAALQGGHTGAALLKDLVICQDLEERVHLFGAAGQLQHPPLASLRSESHSGPPHGLLDALTRLFDLKD